MLHPIERAADLAEQVDEWLSTNHTTSKFWPVSQRSQSLVLLGALFISLAFQYPPFRHTPTLYDSLRTVNDILPIAMVGWSFLAVGIFAIGAGLARRGKKLAFMASSALTSMWGATWLIESSLFIGDTDRGVGQAILYAIFTLYVWKSSAGTTGAKR